MKAILETRDLVKYYGSGDNLVKAIDHTDIRVEPGEFVISAGPSSADLPLSVSVEVKK